MKPAIPIQISPGELIDKITILEIKLDRLDDPIKRANVQTEYDVLKSAFDAFIPVTIASGALRRELREKNEKLWNVEDKLRECERLSSFGAQFIEFG